MKKALLFILSGVIFISCSRKSTPQGETYETETEVETEPENRNSGKVAGLSPNWRYSYSTEKDAPQVSPNSSLPNMNFDQSNNTVSVDGCNDLIASYSISGNRLSFSDIEVVNKKCRNDSLERYVFNFMKNVSSYKLQNNHLFLYHKAGNSRFIVFAKRSR